MSIILDTKFSKQLQLDFLLQTLDVDKLAIGSFFTCYRCWNLGHTSHSLVDPCTNRYNPNLSLSKYQEIVRLIKEC
jgi:hypothetical protein